MLNNVLCYVASALVISLLIVPIFAELIVEMHDENFHTFESEYCVFCVISDSQTWKIPFKPAEGASS